jgi:isocitrate dehydrogenase kinase/phosphatase
MAILTRRAPNRFKRQDWQGVRADAVQRLDLYKDAIDRIEHNIRRLMADQIENKEVWAAIKAAYSHRLIQNDDWELVETFLIPSPAASLTQWVSMLKSSL